MDLGPSLSEESESKLEGALDRMRDRCEIAEAEVLVWRENYDAAVKILAVVAPSDFVQAFEDKAFKEYLAA